MTRYSFRNSMLLMLPVMLLSAAVPIASAGFLVTTFAAPPFPDTDANVGVSGYVIENFEDTTLAAGLKIGLLGGPSSASLPSTFDPVNDDPFSDVFALGVWDGSHLLINQAANQVPGCGYNCGGWGEILLEFSPATTSVGFSVQQMDSSLNLYANGAGAAFQTVALSRGYIRIDATGVDTIQSLRLQLTNSGDGISVDHLAFAPGQVTGPVPEPGTMGLLGAALGVLWIRARRRA